MDETKRLVLAVAEGPVERALVRAQCDGSEIIDLPDPNAPDDALEAFSRRLDLLDDTALVPMRVMWRPALRDGRRRARVSDLVLGRDPYRPTVRQQHVIADAHPDRRSVVAGDPATVAELRARWQDEASSPEVHGFARYVVRRALLALERADHRILGLQYKAPRLLTEEILASARFADGLDALQAKVGPARASREEAEAMLQELATGWGRLFADVLPFTGRKVFERGFDPVIDLDADQVEQVRETLEENPAILLWSHRSNLDNQVLSVALHENGLPKAHTFAGINMAFGPMGAIFRRAGVIFIRRTIGDDPLYKFVLKEYVGYLVSKRFLLSWSIEGTRSRTGKMLPPKLGLLGYVADAYLQGRSEDIMLQPVAIGFDQLHEIAEYADYARGGAKAAEGFGWLLGFINAQGDRNFGKIYIRFAEPVSMRDFLGPPGGETALDPAARRLALQKMAFEVAWRINRATPVTAISLVTSMLLAFQGLGVTAHQVQRALSEVLAYLDEMEVPQAASVEGLRTAQGVRGTLAALVEGGTASTVDSGRETVWMITADKQLEATFYRNSIIHVFLDAALCELAILAAGEADGDRVEAFWTAAYRLRELLKFEFYFEERSEFRRRMSAEMERPTPDWEARLRSGQTMELLADRRVFVTPFTIRPFFEAYMIVFDVLSHTDGPIDRQRVVKDALALGRQYVAQRKVASSEPVSALLFGTALQVAEAEGEEKSADVHAELVAILGHVATIERVATKQFFG